MQHRLQELVKQWSIFDYSGGNVDLALAPCRIYRVLEQFAPGGASASEAHIYNSATVSGGGSDRITIGNSTAYTCWVDLGSNGRVFDQGVSIEWSGANFASGDQLVIVYTPE